MEERKAAFLKAAKGVCVATGATLLCMVLLALVVVFLRISDNALFLMNQLAKVASIFAGAYFAVGPGGLVDGKEVEMVDAKGDRVVVSKYAGTEYKCGSDTFLIVRQSDILAKVL